MNVKVETLQNNVDKILKNAYGFSKKQAYVGFPQENNQRTFVDNYIFKEKQKRKNTKKSVSAASDIVNNATLAMRHEYGFKTPDGGWSPPRPVLRPGLQKAMPNVLKILKEGAAKGLWNVKYVDEALIKAGLEGYRQVKLQWRTKDWWSERAKTISERTRKEREARGFGGIEPLTVTGQFQASLKSFVK